MHGPIRQTYHRLTNSKNVTPQVWDRLETRISHWCSAVNQTRPPTCCRTFHPRAAWGSWCTRWFWMPSGSGDRNFVQHLYWLETQAHHIFSDRGYQFWRRCICKIPRAVCRFLVRLPTGIWLQFARWKTNSIWTEWYGMAFALLVMFIELRLGCSLCRFNSSKYTMSISGIGHPQRITCDATRVFTATRAMMVLWSKPRTVTSSFSWFICSPARWRKNPIRSA